MESDKIEIQLEKYFEGETSIDEEKELSHYFSSSNVSPHLEQYKPLFGYFSQAKEPKFQKEVLLHPKKRNLMWLSIAASVLLLLGIGTFSYVNYFKASENQDLGTYDDPKVALKETQKALALLSNHVNAGIESVKYVKEYENSKNLIFKQ